MTNPMQDQQRINDALEERLRASITGWMRETFHWHEQDKKHRARIVGLEAKLAVAVMALERVAAWGEGVAPEAVDHENCLAWARRDAKAALAEIRK